jgi:RND family efflux transporter MFP subunit
MSNARTGFASSGILFAAVILSTVGCDEKHPKAVELPPPVIHVSLPVERTVTDYQVFTARTQAVQSVDIKARVTGYVTKIHFTDGQDVAEGAVLFQIDDRPYKAALDGAKGSLEVAKAAIVKAQAEYDIALDVQKQDKGAISIAQVTSRRGARDEAKANVEVAKANLENAQLNYGWCKVTAPFAGRTNTHFVDVGALVAQNVTTLTNVVSYKPTWAYFDVDENSAIRYEQRVEKGEVKSLRKNDVPVAMALVGDTDFPIQGVTDFVSNQIDPNTGSMRMRAVFPNENGSLVAGMFGRIRVATSAPHKALLVNDAAIGTNQGQRFILVINSKDEVEYRIVDVGQLHGGLREVMRFREVTETGPDGKGTLKKVEVLTPTDRVVVDGLQRVRPGAKADPKEVDMTTLLLKAR